MPQTTAMVSNQKRALLEATSLAVSARTIRICSTPVYASQKLFLQHLRDELNVDHVKAAAARIECASDGHLLALELLCLLRVIKLIFAITRHFQHIHAASLHDRALDFLRCWLLLLCRRIIHGSRVLGLLFRNGAVSCRQWLRNRLWLLRF